MVTQYLEDKVSHIYARRSSKNNVRSRYTLNIKGIPYKTIWVEFPDVKALCQKIGAAPTLPLPDGTMMYTLPTLYDPNTKTAVSDSAAIARYLDRAYPHAGPTLVPPEVDAHAQRAAHADRVKKPVVWGLFNQFESGGPSTVSGAGVGAVD